MSQGDEERRKAAHSSRTGCRASRKADAAAIGRYARLGEGLRLCPILGGEPISGANWRLLALSLSVSAADALPPTLGRS